jgi:hypothetical protein
MRYGVVLLAVPAITLAADICPLEGTIANNRGEPLSGVSISAYASRKVVAATSSPEGKFSFPDLPCGNYTVGPVGAFYPHAAVKVDTKKQSKLSLITPDSFRFALASQSTRKDSGLAIMSLVKGGLTDYVAAKEPQSTGARYDAHLCENAVAALRPGDLAGFRAKNTGEKLAYCGANFPALPEWEASPETRHQVVARAAPEQLAAYEKLTAEDEQVQFCLRLFGPGGVVWTEPYRAAVRADAMKALGRKPPFTDREFLQAMSTHWMDMNGIHFTTRAEATKGMMAEWAVVEMPVPFGMERLHVAAIMALEAERRAQLERERRAKEVNKLKTLENQAGKTPETETELKKQSTATLPGDRPGDIQLRQAALWLSASEAVLRSTVWPTAASEGYIQLSTMMQWLVDVDGDPAKCAKWESWGPRERTEEVAHVVHLIASAAERILNTPQIEPTGWVSPELIGRYFPSVADPKADDAARGRLTRAAAVADAAFLILLITSDPVL